jgi:hypothetical protein
MIDIETVGKRPDAAIAQIAIAEFSIDWGITDTICVNLDWQQGISEFGRTFCKDTVEWWKTQDTAVRKSVLTGGEPYKEGLLTISEWMQKKYTRSKKVWAWHPQFDMPKIEESFLAAGLEKPWHYRSEIDASFLHYVFGHDISKVDNKTHHALADVKNQVAGVCEFFQNLDSE